MTAVVNPSFELPGSGPGEAQGWTLTSVATAEQWAAFGERAAEAFDAWDGTDVAIFAFASAHLQAAVFGPANKQQESFEAGWDNDTFLLDLASVPTEAAEFDAGLPLQVESFIDWFAGGSWAASWYDVTGQAAPTEAFDQGWSGNEASAFDWSGVTAATAQFDTTPEDVEDFEEDFSTLVMTTL